MTKSRNASILQHTVIKAYVGQRIFGLRCENLRVLSLMLAGRNLALYIENTDSTTRDPRSRVVTAVVMDL